MSAKWKASETKYKARRATRSLLGPRATTAAVPLNDLTWDTEKTTRCLHPFLCSRGRYVQSSFGRGVHDPEVLRRVSYDMVGWDPTPSSGGHYVKSISSSDWSVMMGGEGSLAVRQDSPGGGACHTRRPT